MSSPPSRPRFGTFRAIVVGVVVYSVWSFWQYSGPDWKGWQLQQQLQVTFAPDTEDTANDHHSSSSFSSSAPRFAIMSSFVPSSQWIDGHKRLDETNLEMLLNKACYCYRHGYEFIFNMTHGFPPSSNTRRNFTPYWQEYGTWSRVPHIRDRLQDFDWILYADIDYVVVNHSRPLADFLDEWHSYNLSPSIYVPRDFQSRNFYTFSAFCVLIRNSPFGRAVVQRWMDFAHGICPRGNLSPVPRKYTWEDSDQPGIWYALTQTHRDFFPNYVNATRDAKLWIVQQEGAVCNATSGLVITDRAFGPETNAYFRHVHAVIGDSGVDLQDMPQDQPIVWSLGPTTNTGGGPFGGLGIQAKWMAAKDRNETFQQSFAVHVGSSHLSKLSRIHEQCRREYGCYANYTDGENGRLRIGCGDKEYTVAQPHVLQNNTPKGD